MAKYAHRTRATVNASKSEIERTCARYGAEDFLIGVVDGFAGVVFSVDGRRVRFRVDLSDADEAETKRLWRCMLLSIKARLEIVAAGIETFDEAFMPNIVMPDGKTVAEHAVPKIRDALEGKPPVPLLPVFG